MRDFRWPPPPGGGPEPYGPGPRGPHTGRPTLPLPVTDLVETPHGVALEQLVTGSGEPVTVFAHGLAASIAETRPLGSGVPGQKVYFQFRGHGRSDAPDGEWSYEDLARDLRAVADLAGATQAVGVSLGAGALCRLLVDSPTRFARVVFFLPAALDTPRPGRAQVRLAALTEALEQGDMARLAGLVAQEAPASVRETPAGWAFVRQRMEHLVHHGLSPGLLGLAGRVPVPDPGALSAVTAAALVIGCEGDELHPASVARELAGAIPGARLHVYDQPDVLWTQRADLRRRVSTFLGG